jgi:transcription-repair coupling factor (superfamily II helicase)
VRIDLPVTAYVPPDYIAYEASKIDAHRRIARSRDLNALGDVKAELNDRFGPPPEPVESLLTLQAIRLKAGELSASSVSYRGKRLQLEGVDLDDDWAARLRASHERLVYFKQQRALTAHRESSDSHLLIWVEATLDAILEARVSHDPSSIPGRDSL